MNSRGEINLRNFMIAAIVMSAMVFVGTSMIADVVSKNTDMQMGSDSIQFNRSFNKFQDFKEETEAMQSNITGSKITDSSIFGPLASLIQGTWGSIKGTFVSIGLVKTMFTNDLANSGIQFPWWAGMITSTLITALLAFLLISAIWRWKM